MSIVNILEAKTHLSRLVERLESGAESEIVIARNGRPVARLVPLQAQPAQRRIGIAKGQFTVPESIDAANAQIEALFCGKPRQ
jgi:prevent-host-death family protein